MTFKKNILIAPLNWGLGHATRCVPIINKIIEQGHNPIIASDGEALLFLSKEFPNIKLITLPSYGIRYTSRQKLFKLKLMYLSTKFTSVSKQEHTATQKIVEEEKISLIISDNRFGVYSGKVKSIYITHQLKVFSGIFTSITTHIHQNIIKKFDECWIPDFSGKNNFTGLLSDEELSVKKKFIGSLSRFDFVDDKKKYDVLILLSGVEPCRSSLENKLMSEFSKYKGKVLFVRGVVSDSKKKLQDDDAMKVVNYLNTSELQLALNQSDLVIARSGYSTIMDLCATRKKAYFIPTPGQTEQEYLAKRFKQLRIAPFSSQEEFSITKLDELENYSGFSNKLKETKCLDLNFF